MKAFVAIQDFGRDDQKRDLCATIERVTMFHAHVTDAGNVLVPCEVRQLGRLFAMLAGDAATNWIEYTIQFDA